LERQVTDAGSDVERAQELSKELDALKAREDELFEQWEELDQLVQELSSK
jgi:predicted  nucleic acid-binding Zn-ribbon protein